MGFCGKNVTKAACDAQDYDYECVDRMYKHNEFLKTGIQVLTPLLKKENPERFGDHGFSIVCWMHNVGAKIQAFANPSPISNHITTLESR